MGGRLQREGTYVYVWLINFVVQQKLTQHCKAIILQLKKENTLKDHWDNIRYTNIHILGVPEGGERERGRKDIWWNSDPK